MHPYEMVEPPLLSMKKQMKSISLRLAHRKKKKKVWQAQQKPNLETTNLKTIILNFISLTSSWRLLLATSMLGLLQGVGIQAFQSFVLPRAHEFYRTHESILQFCTTDTAFYSEILFHSAVVDTHTLSLDLQLWASFQLALFKTPLLTTYWHVVLGFFFPQVRVEIERVDQSSLQAPRIIYHFLW